MAESCAVAFGRYLRMLRERRALSLDDVATMSRSLADPVDKSYLSRCENGHYGVGFSKAITLSRIYDVSTEVLAERLELDTELDRIAGPDTAGLSHGELVKRGVAAVGRGAAWEMYAHFRDAVHLALHADLSPTFRDREEQHLIACMNASTAAGRLGRSRFSLHELEYIRGVGHLGPSMEPLLLDLLSSRYRILGELDKARGFADEAVRMAEEEGSATALGYAYSNRARLALQEKEFEQAVTHYRVAFTAHRQAGRVNECASTHLNLANAYFCLHRPKAARRALAASERLATSLGATRTRALVRIVLGEIEEADGRRMEATRQWREALDMAKHIRDKIVQFKAEFFLFRQALRQGEDAVAGAIGRRLSRLAAWIPSDVEELPEFKELTNRRPTKRRRRVPASQL